MTDIRRGLGGQSAILREFCISPLKGISNYGEKQMGNKGDEMHPNSLNNLKPWFTKEKAQEAQKNSVISRRANKEAREALKLTMKDWKLFQSDVLAEADMSSIDILKIIMFKHLEDEDYHAASDIAKSIAEFEQPKLARVESINQEIKTDELTDDELQAKLSELMEGTKDGES